MDAKSLHQHRQELFRDTVHFKKTKRPPLFCNAWTWKYMDEGVKLSVGFGTRNPNAVTDALGGGYHKVDDEKKVVVVLDHTLMETDEYPEFAEVPQSMPRGCGGLPYPVPDLPGDLMAARDKRFLRISLPVLLIHADL